MARAGEEPSEAWAVFFKIPGFLLGQNVSYFQSPARTSSLSFISCISSSRSFHLQYTMFFTSILLATAATLAAAQSVTTTSSAPTSSSTCAAQQYERSESQIRRVLYADHSQSS